MKNNLIPWGKFKNYIRITGLSFLALVFFVSGNFANVTMAKIFTDNMILQRDVKVPVWGWAGKGEKVTTTFAGKKYNAVPDVNGKWVVYLDAHAVGGPYELKVKGKNEIILKNILMGDVWLCSGQSNMEMPVDGWGKINNYEAEIAQANFPDIRIFTVDKKIGLVPEKDLTGGTWETCSPATIGAFSAVGYFFGRNLNKVLNVPIGLINSSWGGTDAETWVSAGSINKMDDLKPLIQDLHNIDISKLKSELEIKAKQWDENVAKNDEGLMQKWYKPDMDDTAWKTMNIPQVWESAGLPDFDGVVWFRYQIILSKEEVQAGILLNLGMIDDSDVSYVNGVVAGSILNSYTSNRNYKVDPAVLKEGKNTIVIRVIDTGGGGGIYGVTKDINYVSNTGTHSLAGMWKFKVGIKTSPKSDTNVGPNSFPTLLYNGMIDPLLPIAVKGTIWYQGENNVSRAFQYRNLFPMLINDWRIQFKNLKMPFLFVQLANFLPAMNMPVESTWAELREAQSMTLSLPNTGMATIIDIGDALDIHPKNKQDVGYRLSLQALKVSYGKDIVFSGPTYKSMRVDGNKIRIKFDNIGSGLVSKDKYGYVKGFTIAAEDRKFVWAKAVIENDEVVVYSDMITNPVSVRYCWADNPDDANLYNKENLPAVPFRTDVWKGITER